MLAGALVLALPGIFQALPLEHVYSPNERNMYAYGYIQHQVLASNASSPTAVILLGGSSLVDASAPAETLGAKLTQTTGTATKVYQLASGGQSLFEGLVLLHNLEAPPGSTVVLVLSRRRFSAGPSSIARSIRNPRFPFLDYTAAVAFVSDEAMVALEASRINNGTGSMRYDQIGWFSEWLAERYVDPMLACDPTAVSLTLRGIACAWPDLRLLSGSNPPGKRARRAREKRSGDKFERHAQKIIKAGRIDAFAQYHRLNEVLATETIRIAKEKKLNIVMLDLPRHERAIALEAPTELAYRDMLARLVARGATYVDLGESTEFGRREFRDLYHFSRRGVKLFTPTFVDTLATHIKDTP